MKQKACAKEDNVGVSAYHEVTSVTHDQLKPKLNRSTTIALGYTTMSTWSVYSTASATALVAGGLNVFFWGLLICVICNTAAAISLAEVAAMFPRGNQALWAYCIAPNSHRRVLAYFMNWFVLIGFMLLGVSGAVSLSQIVLAMVQITHPTFVIQEFHIPLLMNAWSVVFCLFGVFGSALIAKVNRFNIIWNILLFFTVSLTLIIQSRSQYNSAKAAFTMLVNQSKWPNVFVPWVSSMSQAALSTTAFDVVSHFSEEMHQPQKDLPLAMVSAIGLNGIVGLLYAVIFDFCLPTDANSLLSTPTGFAFAQLLLDKTKSRAGTIILLIAFIFSLIWTMADLTLATARIACSFAKQGGLPKIFMRIHSRLDTPLFCVVLVLLIDMGLAWIYVGSTSAFSAFISAPAVVLAWTYATISAYMLFWGRPFLSLKSTFYLSKISSCLVNVLTILFSICITIFFCLPATNPVSVSSMNYTCVILVAALTAPAAIWFLFAHRHYVGPFII